MPGLPIEVQRDSSMKDACGQLCVTKLLTKWMDTKWQTFNMEAHQLDDAIATTALQREGSD
jgi:hypothetical protein